MSVEITYSNRGFQGYGEPIVTAVYGDRIRLYESSIAGKGPHVWLESVEGQRHGSGEARAHLSVDEAKALRDRLDAFLDQRDPARRGLYRTDMWQAKCTGCGRVETDYGEYTAWGDESTPIEQVTEYYDDGAWFKRERVVEVIPKSDDYPFDRKVYEIVDLLCPDCQKCEVCDEPAYAVHEHLVCEDHEDHDFGGGDG